MNCMAKDKALSVDGISDTIFKKSTWRKLWQKHCRDNGWELEDKNAESMFVWEVEDKLAEQL